MNGDILTGIGRFFTELFRDITSGLILFGGPLDIAIAMLDVLTTTMVIYYILRLLRDSRAWQLLKGVILIIAFALAGSLAGLTTLGFILNNTISVLAIAFVIIFQPELRRALETVGRNSFSMLTAGGEYAVSASVIQNMIESIVRACEQMSATRTGALIILERETRLGELLDQENVVTLDSSISATVLQQIFYKGSPLHDGAVLIRGGRIAGARIHVPLSDNYHLRRVSGTRHRAAVGASEIGDTIAIVVSEERGTISIAMEGRLFVLDNADALRTLLHKLLNPTRPAKGWTGLFRGRRADRDAAVTAVRDRRPRPAGLSAPGEDRMTDRKRPDGSERKPDGSERKADGSERKAESAELRSEAGEGRPADPAPALAPAAAVAGDGPGSSAQRRTARSRSTILIEDPKSAVRPKPPRRQQILLLAASFAIALVLFLYVQVTINPVASRTFTTTLRYEGIETAEGKGFDVQVPIESVQVTLMGRQNTIADLRAEDVTAYVDFASVTNTGITQLPVLIRVARLTHLRPTYISPANITVSIRSK